MNPENDIEVVQNLKFPNKSILSGGLEALRQSDIDIERLIAPRSVEVTALLEKYINEIERCNPSLGLIGTTGRQELITRHILDSLAPLGVICRLLEKQVADNKTPRLADAGSGAGLPGIPLAIVLPHVKFTLIERMGRRAGFLRDAVTALGLANARVEEAQVEELARRAAEAGRFAAVTFRAFKPLEPKLLKRLFKLCANGGTLAAYKGRREKIEAEMLPLAALCGGWEAIPCPVPLLDEERHLLLVWAKSPTAIAMRHQS